MDRMDRMAKKELKEERISGEEVFSGKNLKLIKDQVRLPDGQTSTRIVVRHPGAVAVVALHNDQLLMVRQHRYAIGQNLLEIPAGKLDKGEEPLHCAERELREETGHSGDLSLLGKIFTTPGFTDEVLHLYLAVNLVWNPLEPDQDEFLTVETLPWVEAVRMAEKGGFDDAKTIIGILWAKERMK